MPKHLSYLLLTLLFPFGAIAQIGIPPPPERDTTRNTIKIENAKSIEFINTGKQTEKHLVGEIVLAQNDLIMFADSMVIIDQNVRAYGNVIIEQDSVSIFANRLKYSGNTQKATLYNDVVLTDGKQQLNTDQLDYDRQTKIAEYHTGATLQSPTSSLQSKHGYYHSETKQAYFKGEVTLVDTNFTLQADTLHLDTENDISYFHGPTEIQTEDRQIYCEGGFYNSEKNYAEFEQNVKFKSDNQYATADKIIYDNNTGKTYFEGKTNLQDESRIIQADEVTFDEKLKVSFFRKNVKIADSTQVIFADSLDYYEERNFLKAWGEVVIQSRARDIWADSLQYDQNTGASRAWGDVVMIDSTQSIWADYVDYSSNDGNSEAKGKVLIINHKDDLTIECKHAIYNDSTQFIHATGRPLLRSLIDADTLYLAADTLRAFKPDTLTEGRILTAQKNVRAYKSDFQSVSNRMIYSTVDSVFRFYENPVVWSDTSQFSADTIFIFQKNNNIQKIELLQQAFILNLVDDTFYNQIKGQDIFVRFRDNEARLMDVRKQGETIYYIQDEKKAYIGVNQTQCDDMLIYFGDNQVEKIKFYQQPNADITPMRQADHNALRLSGFNWQEKRRPISPADVRYRQKTKSEDVSTPPLETKN